MKEIKLHLSSKSAKVDDDKFELLSQYKWRETHYGYTHANIKQENGSWKYVFMHQMLFPNSNMWIDHIDRDRLNNQMSNLREVTHRENNWNKKRGSSKYCGVSRNERSDKWIARTTLNGKETHIGYFDSEKDAALAVDKFIRENDIDLREEFLNFPEINNYDDLIIFRRNIKSKYIGVSVDRGLFIAVIKCPVTYKASKVGTFDDEYQCALFRDWIIRMYFPNRPLIKLNFPDITNYPAFTFHENKNLLNKKSKYTGVSLAKDKRSNIFHYWRSQVRHKGKTYQCGLFRIDLPNSEELAGRAYDRKVIELGLAEEKKLNFPLMDYLVDIPDFEC